MRVSREALALFVLCGFDLALSIYLIGIGHAGEANPIMAFFLSHGLGVLALVKGSLMLGPLALLEWCRRHNPRFTCAGMRLAIAAYVILLGTGWIVQPLVQTAKHNNRARIEAVTIRVPRPSSVTVAPGAARDDS